MTRGCNLGAWIRAGRADGWERYQERLGWRLGNVAFFARWGAPIGLDQLRPLPSGVMPLPNIALPQGGDRAGREALVDELERFGRPAIVRYAAEFDRSGEEPQRFVADWRALRSLVRDRCPMAHFAWTPTAEGLQPWSLRAEPYWPGEEHVDIAGLDAYDMPGSAPRSFAEIVQAPVAWYRRHAPSLEVAVLETGVARGSVRGDGYRARWIEEMAHALEHELRGIVRWVTYFDSAPPSEPGHDWRLRPRSRAWHAWQRIHHGRFFHSRPFRRQ